tara:strand:- start:267 stop:491 length:225 start_codon:yes stop_codon:yes gene_type:complete
MEQQQVALPVEVIEIIKQKPEATLMCLASFFQFGLQKEKGVMLKDEALWDFLLEQIVKLDAELIKQETCDDELN